MSFICSQLHCTVPAYNFPVTAMAIAPNTNNLVIAHSDQQVREIPVLSNPFLLDSNLEAGILGSCGELFFEGVGGYKVVFSCVK